MRYRPFGKSGLVVSVVSLLLDGATCHATRDWRQIIHTALECGVNSFEVANESPHLLEALEQTLAHVERELLFFVWRPRALAADPRPTIEAFLTRTGLGYLDLLLFETLPPPAEVLDGIRFDRRVRALALTAGDDTDDLLRAGLGFEALAAPYHPLSGWRDRNRLKAAAERDMAVIAQDILPEALQEKQAAPRKRSLFSRPEPLAGAGGYHFLHNTSGWDPETLCLAYVLTEPSVTTVLVAARRPADVERLAEIPDRDLPSGVAAQIEMARFSADARREA